MVDNFEKKVSITVNGKAHQASIEPRMTLLDFLRDEAGLTGTHAGCEHGVCGRGEGWGGEASLHLLALRAGWKSKSHLLG